VIETAHTPSPARQHEFEPAHGLPERLPSTERLLWQGAPDWRALARRAFHLRKLAIYFGVLIVWRAADTAAGGAGPVDVLLALPGPMAMAATGLGLVALLAWLSARTAVYTITDRRVVMRVGIVLTLTFNLPFKRIVAADFSPGPGDYGDIALTLAETDRIAWLHLWPHARPWRLRRAAPALRGVPHARAVAQLLADAWAAASGQAAARHAQPMVERPPADASPALAAR
jgi:hypothetical protein